MHVDFKTSLRRLCDCLSEWNNRSAVVNHIPGELALQLEDIRIGMHDGTTNMCWLVLYTVLVDYVAGICLFKIKKTSESNTFEPRHAKTC